MELRNKIWEFQWKIDDGTLVVFVKTIVDSRKIYSIFTDPYMQKGTRWFIRSISSLIWYFVWFFDWIFGTKLFSFHFHFFRKCIYYLEKVLYWSNCRWYNKWKCFQTFFDFYIDTNFTVQSASVVKAAP